MTDTASRFDPLDFGFRHIDLAFQTLHFFERDLGLEPQDKPDVRRINVYLTQDGDFVTIWSGLFDPLMSESALDFEAANKYEILASYTEHLFRGFITTRAEAEVIFKALRLEKYRPNQLSVNGEGQLIFERIEKAS